MVSVPTGHTGYHMPRMLTQAFLDSLKPKKDRFEEADSQSPGLRIIVQPSGAMAWALRYRLNGKQGKVTLGQYPAIPLREARKKAAKAKATIADGVNPNAEKHAALAQAKAKAVENEKPLDLIDNVVDTFVAMHKLKTRIRTAREIERLLRHDVLPKWRGRRLSTISLAEATALTDAIVAEGKPVLANRVVGALKVFGKWAQQRGRTTTNIFADLPKPAKETARDRVLSPVELRALLIALDAEPDPYPYRPLVKLLLLLGARRSEVAEMKWSEIDVDAKVWRLPKERSKNGFEHTMPLPDDAVDILRSLPRVEGSDLVFTRDGVRPVRGFIRIKERLDEAMAVTGWTFHDLRRTAASGMAEIGVAPHIIERALNHRSGVIRGVAAIYNRHRISPRCGPRSKHGRIAFARSRRATTRRTSSTSARRCDDPRRDHRGRIRGDCQNARARQRRLRERGQRARRALRLANARGGRPSQGHARPGRELQRRDTEAGDGIGLAMRAIAWLAVAQSRPILYSLPQRRCYARHVVDRPASRHAGLHSRFHVPSPCSMEVQPCPCHLRPVIRLRH